MDSPLSEPDSLSSAGATTEPLPNSEADDLPLSSSPVRMRRSRSRSLHAPAPGDGGESDSSLTEQSDSEAEPSAAADEEEDEDAAGAAASELGDDEQEDDDEEEEEPVQATPRGSKRPRPLVTEDDDDDDVARAIHARKRVGAPAMSDNDDDDELSSASDDARDADHRSRALDPPSKRARTDAEGSVVSSSTVGASGHPRAAGSAADSLSELDDDDEEEDAAPSALQATEGATAVDAVDPARSNDAAPAPTASPKAKKPARGRGNGRPRGLGARGRPRAGPKAAEARTRSESPLSAVESEVGEVDPDAAMTDAVQAGETPMEEEEEEGDAGVTAATESDAAAIKELEDEANAVETLAAGTGGGLGAAAPRNAPRGRGKAKGRVRGRGAGKAGEAAMERSTSNGSSGEPFKPFGDSTSASASSSAFSSLPALPAPSGLVELATAPDALAHQLVELAEAEADVAAGSGSRSASGSGEGAEAEGSAAPMEGVEGDEEPATQDSVRLGAPLELEDGRAAEEVEEERPAPPPSTKKGAAGKKGGKKGKGKEKALPPPPVEADGAGDDDGAYEGEEEEDTSDDAFMRKRAEAMEALTKIEITFARLRDLLYLERLADIEKERLAIETGAHPELIHLTQLIELRRNRKLELARSWLDGLEGAYQVQFTDREHANWNSWQDDRGRERMRMLDEANSKRRRLEREKRAIERPQDDSLASMLAPRPPPAVPLHHRRRLGFEGEPLAENEITWALRHPDVRVDASVRGLDDEAMYGDLERMGLREPIRHPLYAYDAVYAQPHGLGGPSFADPRTAQLANYPYGGYDAPTLAMQQQHAFPGSFGSLPPLPQHQRVESGPSRPPSNPRLAQGFPAELGGGQPGYPPASRAFGNGHYPQTYAEVEAWQHQHQQQRHGGHAAFDEEQRRRTISAGGSLGAHRSHESLDAVAAHRQNGYTPSAAVVATAGRGDDDPTGGRTTPTHASAAAKARFTLDEHMSTRSPKGPASSSSVASSASKAPAGSSSAAAAAAAAAAARNPAFMSIPAIPPFDRNRHEQTIRARQAAAGPGTSTSPAPPVLPPTLKHQPVATAAPLFAPSQAQQQQAAAAVSTQAQGQGSFPAYAVPQRAA
ncbi:hypothetical protein JCM10450v2_003939 [Rhodotorula kratochvilovae]